MPSFKEVAKIRLPTPHEKQKVFTDWETLHPNAQVLVAPAGVKVGKTFGCSLWLLTQTLINHGFYNVWIAPTLYKTRIGYRYMKAMMPDIPSVRFRDGEQEILFSNDSFIKCLHGRDAEITVEGEAIDSFVIDEAGKLQAQLWHSLFTTITQTMGKGIITGTPRGRSWYYDLFKKAQAGDPMLCWALLQTIDSPFIKLEMIERARRILPPHLFLQYYLSQFVSDSTVYGDLSRIWQDEIIVENPSFWISSDIAARQLPVCIGLDLAKRRDFTVMTAVNAMGQTVGYVRFKGKPFIDQAKALARFSKYFIGSDNEIRYDRTGIGDVVGELIVREMENVPGDWRITPVVFTNASKSEMVSLLNHAIESDGWKCPRIPRVEHEMTSLEVTSSKSGLHSYSAPGGDHDDVHWSFALAISGIMADVKIGNQLDMIEAAMSGKLLDIDEREESDEDMEDNDDIFPKIDVDSDDELVDLEVI